MKPLEGKEMGGQGGDFVQFRTLHLKKPQKNLVCIKLYDNSIYLHMNHKFFIEGYAMH